LADKEIPLEQPQEFKPVVVPDNVYQARVKETRINVHPQFGESLIIDFEIIAGSETGKVIGGFASLKKLTKKTKLWRWAKNLGAPVPEVIGQTFNPNSLIGKVGRILTQQMQRVDNQGRPFLNSTVKDVLGPEGSGQPSSQTIVQPQPTLPPDSTGTPLPPQPIVIAKQQTTANKMELLRNLQGKDFTQENLQTLGFNLQEIEFLRNFGYIYEPRQGIFRLAGS